MHVQKLQTPCEVVSCARGRSRPRVDFAHLEDASEQVEGPRCDQQACVYQGCSRLEWRASEKGGQMHFKNEKPFKMSKRAGEFISAQDLLNEVDKDSIRFMMLNRSNDVELDFDFEASESKQISVTRVFFLLPLLTHNFNAQLSSNFHRFVNLCIC